MPNAPASVAVATLLALLSTQAMALGVGRFDNHGALGSPLHMAVDLRLDEGESLSRECISVDALVGESRLAPSSLRWALEPGSDAAGRRLRIASNVVIDEPVVTLTVQFTCPTRLTRKFVALIDPPGISLATAGTVPAPVAVPYIPVEPATAPALKVAESAQTQPPAAKPRSARAAPKPRREAATRRASAQRNVAAAPARPRGAAQNTARASAAPAAGARLKLEAADDAATRAGLDLREASQAAAAASAVSAVAAAASAAEDPALAQARERLQALEDNFTRLQAEGRATQASLLQMQQRLQEAEAQRYANPLVYGLGALAALLAAALVVLLWKRPPSQAATAPWYGDSAEPEARVAADDWQTPETMPPALPRREETSLPETTASPMMLSQVHALASETSATGGRPEVADPALAVEELIDLEQQAEFFVVLGQDEAAIDLLMGHLRSSGGASPLPYLKLLEIYRRRGDREASERIRERFNRRFNAYAPEWQADPAEGRTLADYPTVTASLQEIWSTPAQAMRALEASLFRRDGSASTFDLPAYRELLFLYSVARDLAEREAQTSNVDLLLPLDNDEGEPSALTRLHPSMTAPMRIDPPAEVDVDITSLDDGVGIDSGRASRLVTDFGPTSGAMPLGIEPSRTRH
jgi:pilus assembly protein FimV